MKLGASEVNLEFVFGNLSSVIYVLSIINVFKMLEVFLPLLDPGVSIGALSGMHFVWYQNEHV